MAATDLKAPEMTKASATQTAPEARAAPHARPPLRTRVARGLAFDKIGAVYVWALIAIVFAIWVPDRFPQLATAKQILNANALTAMAALSIVIPLSARVFDLSFAFTMSLAGIVTAHFVAAGLPLPAAVALGVLTGIGIGLVNAVVVVT